MKPNIPDISVDSVSDHSLTLERVGMRGIECPVLVTVGGKPTLLPAKVNAFVSLDQPKAKGIHMSRLYLLVTDALEKNELNPSVLRKLLAAILDSHQGISETAEIKVSFQLPIKRPALQSQESGWRQYPISFSCKLQNGKVTFRGMLELMYSSTCPCSAALSRHLSQDAFLKKFKDRQVEAEEVHAWLGTQESAQGVPHAQRSRAKIVLESSNEMDMPELVDQLESALGTPVQAAVKRVDEQEFARLNAQNLMFCEDAGRKLKAYLDSRDEITDYYAEVIHEESLHPHDAVSVVVKGVPGGLRIQDLN